MTTLEKKKKVFSGGAKVAIIIAALCGLLLGANYYIDSMRESLWKQSVADVLEITEQEAHAFEVYFRQGFTMLEGRANNFAQYESTDEEAIEKKLDLYEEGDPSFAVMDLTHGILYFNSSSQTTLPEEEVAAYLELPGQGILEPFLGEYNGQQMLGYYERFTFADGAEGMVRKSCLLSDVAKEFSQSFFDDTGFSYVISSEGDIMLRSNNPNSNRTFSNVFDVIAAEKNTDADENAFRDGLSNGKRGAMRLIFNSEECVFTFTPIAELTGGKGVTFATGTPISNSMTELYTNMRYLQYGTLQKLGLGHFDSWASSFGETQTAIELAPEGTGYRAKTRFAKFFNLPELIALFKESADIQTPDMLNLPVPEAEYENVVLKPSEYQKDMVASLAERAEAVRDRQVQPYEDNMLKITNDGRKLALDQRLINDMLPDDENSKASTCVEKAFEIWEQTKEQKSTQLIFCDLSTPKGDGTFNVYEDIRNKLIEKGVPPEKSHLYMKQIRSLGKRSCSGK